MKKIVFSAVVLIGVLALGGEILAVAPVLSEVTPVTTPTSDNTPNYTFNSDQVGTITCTGGCTCSTAPAAVVGNNTITFDTLADATYGGCVVHVTNGGLEVGDQNVTSFLVDTTGPTGSIAYAGTSPTNDDTPTLNLTIADAGVGTAGAQMSFSCDNATWSAWEAYATPKTNFDVNSGANGCTVADGAKAVYVRFRDSLLNVGSSYDTGIFVLDTALPTANPVSISSNNANPVWAKTGNTITVSFTPNESIGSCSGTIATKPAICNSGLGTLTRVTDGTEAEGPVAFSFTMTDLAGNVSAPAITSVTDASSVTFDKTAPTLQSVTRNPNTGWRKAGDTVTYTLNFDESVDLSGGLGLTATNATGAPSNNFGSFSATHTVTFTVQNPDDGVIALAGSLTVQDQAGNVPGAFLAAAIEALRPAGTLTADAVAPVISGISLNFTGGGQLLADNYINKVENSSDPDRNNPLVTVTYTETNPVWAYALVPASTVDCSAVAPASYGATIPTATNIANGVWKICARLNDLAGNTTAYSAPSAQFEKDIIDPALSSIAIHAYRGDDHAVEKYSDTTLGVTTWYAKQGDFIKLEFVTSEKIKTPGASATFFHLGGDFAAEGVAITNVGGDEVTWELTLSTDAADPEGVVDFFIPLHDLADNNTLDLTDADTTAAGFRVVYDNTRPMLPNDVVDLDGDPTSDLKPRANAVISWNNDQDPDVDSWDGVTAGIWKYHFLETNPYVKADPNGSSVNPYDDSRLITDWTGALTSAPYLAQDNEVHRGSYVVSFPYPQDPGYLAYPASTYVGALANATVLAPAKSFDGTTTQLTPWTNYNSLIPPRKNDLGQQYHPYRFHMVVVDKAGNYSCGNSGQVGYDPANLGTYLYCSTEAALNWTGPFVYEQPYTVSITGTVKDKAGNPIHGAQVWAVSRFGEYCNGKKEVCSDSTDATGHYAIPVNKDQDYNVTFYRPGYFMEKNDGGIWPIGDPLDEIYDDLIIYANLENLPGLKQWQTDDQTVHILTDRTFLDGDTLNRTEFFIDSLSGELTISEPKDMDEIDISSLSRITSVQINDPALKITDLGFDKDVSPQTHTFTVLWNKDPFTETVTVVCSRVLSTDDFTCAEAPTTTTHMIITPTGGQTFTVGLPGSDIIWAEINAETNTWKFFRLGPIVHTGSETNSEASYEGGEHGTIYKYSSASSKSGVIVIPANGKSNVRRSGQNRDEISDLREPTLGTQKPFSEYLNDLNQVIPGAIKTIKNYNGYDVFLGYIPGRIKPEQYKEAVSARNFMNTKESSPQTLENGRKEALENAWNNWKKMFGAKEEEVKAVQQDQQDKVVWKRVNKVVMRSKVNEPYDLSDELKNAELERIRIQKERKIWEITRETLEPESRIRRNMYESSLIKMKDPRFFQQFPDGVPLP